MREHWIEQLKRWVCRQIGHKQGETWEFNGLHSVCDRCRHIYSPQES